MTRRLISLLGVLLVVSGCIGQNNTFALPDANMSAAAPYLRGLVADGKIRVGNTDKSQLQAYQQWFAKRSDPADVSGWADLFSGPKECFGYVKGTYTPPDCTPTRIAKIPTTAIFNPECPLFYAYRYNSPSGVPTNSTGGQSSYWPNGYEADSTEPRNDHMELGGDKATGKGVVGSTAQPLYNAATDEVLFFVAGTRLNNDARGRPSQIGCQTANSTDESKLVYLPVRLALGESPHWIIEGFTSALATITVSVDTGPEAAQVRGDGVTFGDHFKSVLSIPRLRRLVVTDANASRISAYATTGANLALPRHITWLSINELTPFYRRSAEKAGGAHCTAAVLAFWTTYGSGDCSNPRVLIDGTASDNSSTWPRGTWLDEYARMPAVFGLDGDDRFGAGQLGTRVLSNDDWLAIKDAMYGLAATATTSTGYSGRNSSRQKDYEIIRKKLEEKSSLVGNDVPAELGGSSKGTLRNDIFPVVSSGGAQSWTNLTDMLKNGGASIQGTVGWYGAVSSAYGLSLGTTEGVGNETMTVTPSFNSVMNDDNFYERFSPLFGSGSISSSSVLFSTGEIDRAGSSKVIKLARSPYSRITITITNTLDTASFSTYRSQWLPTYAVGSLWTLQTIDFDACGLIDVACSIMEAVHDFLRGVVYNSISEGMTSLGSYASGNLLAMPLLDPYQIRQANTNLIHYVIRPEVLDDKIASSNPDVLWCRDPRLKSHLNDHQPAIYGRCYAPNPGFAIFAVSRALMLVLLVFFIARFFIGLMAGKEQQFTIGEFFARAFLAGALVLFADAILRLLGLVIGEVMLLTNIIGSEISGKPYNHLWLFSLYLNPTEAGAAAMAIPFAAIWALIGLVVLLLYSWLRLGIAWAMIVLGPIWIIFLLGSRSSDLFYKSLILFLRSWIMPMISLVILLALFIVAQTLFGGAGDTFALGIFGMLSMVILAVGSWKLSGAFIRRAEQGIRNRFEMSLGAFRSEELDRTAQAGLDREAGELTGGADDSRKQLTAGATGERRRSIREMITGQKAEPGNSRKSKSDLKSLTDGQSGKSESAAGHSTTTKLMPIENKDGSTSYEVVQEKAPKQGKNGSAGFAALEKSETGAIASSVAKSAAKAKARRTGLLLRGDQIDRPQKTCPACGRRIDVRTASCPCGHRFNIAGRTVAIGWGLTRGLKGDFGEAREHYRRTRASIARNIDEVGRAIGRVPGGEAALSGARSISERALNAPRGALLDLADHVGVADHVARRIPRIQLPSSVAKPGPEGRMIDAAQPEEESMGKEIRDASGEFIPRARRRLNFEEATVAQHKVIEEALRAAASWADSLEQEPAELKEWQQAEEERKVAFGQARTVVRQHEQELARAEQAVAAGEHPDGNEASGSDYYALETRRRALNEAQAQADALARPTQLSAESRKIKANLTSARSTAKRRMEDLEKGVGGIEELKQDLYVTDRSGNWRMRKRAAFNAAAFESGVESTLERLRQSGVPDKELTRMRDRYTRASEQLASS